MTAVEDKGYFQGEGKFTYRKRLTKKDAVNKHLCCALQRDAGFLLPSPVITTFKDWVPRTVREITLLSFPSRSAKFPFKKKQPSSNVQGSFYKIILLPFWG